VPDTLALSGIATRSTISGLVRKRTWIQRTDASVITAGLCHFRTDAMQQKLLYHFVGAQQKGFGDGKADGLGGLEIDDKLDRCR